MRITLGIGIGPVRPLGISLEALGGTFSLAENASSGATAGALTGKTMGSTLSLVDDAGGRVALSGTNIVRGATALDYEAATSHSFTVRETLSGATGSPRDTVFTLTVTNVLEVTLSALTGTFAVTEDVPVGTTIGALGAVSSGSTLSLTDDASGKVALSGANIVVGANGVPTPGSYSFTVRETHAEGSNSPRDTTFTLTVNSNIPEISLTAGYDSSEHDEGSVTGPVRWGFNQYTGLGSISQQPFPGQTLTHFMCERDFLGDYGSYSEVSYILFSGNCVAALAGVNSVIVNGTTKTLAGSWTFNGAHTVRYFTAGNAIPAVSGVSYPVKLVV